MGFLGKLVGEVAISAVVTLVTTCVCHAGVSMAINHLAGRPLLTPPSTKDELMTITVTSEPVE